MTMRSILQCLALFALLAGCGTHSDANADDGAMQGTANADLIVGVQTHLGQNWPRVAFRAVDRTLVTHVRDGLSWESVEREKGVLDFENSKLGNLKRLCGANFRLLLTVAPKNKLYEDGRPVETREGQDAFLHYVSALLEELSGCVDGIELGNEINGAGALKTASGADGRQAYFEVLKRLNLEVLPNHEGVLLIGGSSNAVATGFLDSLFDLGLLDYVDAIAVHPYRSEAEGLAWEIDRLRQVMSEHGRTVPIWATEFGDNFETYEEAAPSVLKMLTILEAKGVDRAYWYALIEQSWFPRSGLYSARGRPNPAGKALNFYISTLKPAGNAIEVDTDRTMRLFQFGEGFWVVWGDARKFSVPDGAVVFDAEGARSPTREISATPLIIKGARPNFLEGDIVSDSLYQFGEAPFSYQAIDREGKTIDLVPLDGNFTSSFGNRYLRPLWLSAMSGAVGGTRTNHTTAIVRYTPEAEQNLAMRLCMQPNLSGEGIVTKVLQGGVTLAEANLTEADSITLDLRGARPSQPIDFQFFPAGNAKSGNTFRYRIQFFREGSVLQACSPNLSGWMAQ